MTAVAVELLPAPPAPDTPDPDAAAHHPDLVPPGAQFISDVAAGQSGAAGDRDFHAR